MTGFCRSTITMNKRQLPNQEKMIQKYMQNKDLDFEVTKAVLKDASFHDESYGG